MIVMQVSKPPSWLASGPNGVDHEQNVTIKRVRHATELQSLTELHRCLMLLDTPPHHCLGKL